MTGRTLNTLAVVSQTGESVTFFDATTGERKSRVDKLEAEPHELCYDERSNLLYVTHAYEWGWYPSHGPFSKYITVIDASTREVVDKIPTAPAAGAHYALLDRDNDLLYAACEDGIGDSEYSGGIIAIDLKTKKIVKMIASGWKSHWFVMTPDGKKAYTCNKEADFVSVIDLVKEEMIGKISMPKGCEQPGMSRDGRYVYYPTPTVGFALGDNPPKPEIKVVDTTSDQVVRSLPLNLGPITVHVDVHDRLLIGQYILDKSNRGGPMGQANGRLLVLAGAGDDFKKLAQYDVGACPLTVFASGDGRTAYVSNIFSGTVTVVDLVEESVLRTLEVDPVVPQGKKQCQGAHGLALIA